MSNVPFSVNPPSLPEVWSKFATDYVSALEWTPQGDRIAVGAADGSLRIFNATDGKESWSLDGHAMGLDSLSWRPDGQVLATGGQDGQVKFWFFEGADVRTVSAPGGASWVERVEWNFPDNADPRYPRLASSSGKKLKLWDFEGKLVREFPDQGKTILDVEWHPTRLLIAVAVFGEVRLLGAKDGELHRAYELPQATVKLAWSPNGQWLISGNQDASVHLWRTKTGEEMHMRGFETKVRELSWDSTGNYLATGGSSVASVWDCSGEGPSGRVPDRLEWHADPLTALTFTHEGLTLASASQNGTVAVWHNVTRAEAPVAMARVQGEVTQLAWSPDDSQLAVADSQGGVHLFRVRATID
jgi:WD40 repeat protein